MREFGFGKRPRLNRRAVLRGAAGVTLGLPFLESLPERSAWAAGKDPVFSFFICGVDGIVPASFLPAATGPLTSAGLGAAGKATSALAAHAEHLLFVRGVEWPAPFVSEPHAESLCMAFTGAAPGTYGANATSSGPSADWVIASAVQGETPPLTLYAGPKGYIAERLSFKGAGTATRGEGNPFKFYQQLIDVVPTNRPDISDPEGVKQLLIESRKSVHDLVRDELKSLMSNSRLSTTDKHRLQQHFDAVRDIETTLDGMATGMVKRCSWEGIEITRLQALETFQFKYDGMIEDIVRLHMSLVALAFGCNYNRTATLQWGDGTDSTVYPVPSNAILGGWTFHRISHRTQSDSTTGNNPTAAVAHAEIDAVRMKTFAAGLDHFKARGLADNTFVLWTNGLEDGPSHSSHNIPHLIWGSGGGYLKQGAYVDAGRTTNNQVLNALISAAIQDTGQTMDSFGQGDPGQLAVMRA